jgi:hypothetical protein
MNCTNFVSLTMGSFQMARSTQSGMGCVSFMPQLLPTEGGTLKLQPHFAQVCPDESCESDGESAWSSPEEGARAPVIADSLVASDDLV